VRCGPRLPRAARARRLEHLCVATGEPFFLCDRHSGYSITASCGDQRMSKHETPLTECFWQTCANGAFLPEYPLVRRGSECAQRLVDAVILPDEPHRRLVSSTTPRLLAGTSSLCRRSAGGWACKSPVFGSPCTHVWRRLGALDLALPLFRQRALSSPKGSGCSPILTSRASGRSKG
jgi:hypothetical protein